MSDTGAVATILAAVIAAAAVVMVGLREKATKRLIADCRLAVRDLQRFRQLEDLYATEVAQFKGETPTAVKREMRGRLQSPIANYGEPARIEKLLGLLDKA